MSKEPHFVENLAPSLNETNRSRFPYLFVPLEGCLKNPLYMIVSYDLSFAHS